MMKRIAAGLFVAFFMFGITCAAALAAGVGTPKEAEALVKKAVSEIKSVGKEKAFAEISNPQGKFIDRDLYIFVYDLNGKCVAHGFNQKLIGTRRSYETIGGRGFVATPSKLRNWRKILLTIVVIFQLTVLVVPLSLLTYDTFLLRSGDFSLDNLTLQNWIGDPDPRYNDGEPGVLRNPRIWKAAWNSIRLALYTAFFTALLGVLLGYAIVKGRGTRLSKLVDQLAYLPYVIPGIALGAVYIAMFAKPMGPLPSLYGTFALLVLVSIADKLPYSSRSGVSAMMQVGREFEEAAQLAGASIWHRFRRIIFPLTNAGFISGFLLTFITVMRELSLVILLVTRETQVLASQTMRYIEAGRDQMANIVVLMLIFITVVGNLIIGRFRGGSLRKGLGM